HIHSAASPIIINTATGAPTPKNTASSFPPIDNQTQSTSPLSSFYAQGVIHAPRNFLFPAVLPLHPKFLKSLPKNQTQAPSSIWYLISACQILRLRGLGNNGSSGDDEKAEPWMTSSSPMKNLPAQACPVSLRDARSLVTSGSDSNSVIMVFHHLHQVLHALLL
ncbi:hypothetical protein Goklo_009983, partial [Gossypium klotzschianum]|nr:hypothetical protein [Gossypium klotzschianum]